VREGEGAANPLLLWFWLEVYAPYLGRQPIVPVVTERLGLEGKGGMVRIGAVHYNTVEEIHRLGDALRTMA
jgi:selenocysteine lyase/cysteine desulfurase